MAESKPGCRGRPRILTDSQRILHRRDSVQKAASSRIYLGHQASRWRRMREENNLRCDADVAELLLDRLVGERKGNRAKHFFLKFVWWPNANVIFMMKTKNQSWYSRLSENLLFLKTKAQINQSRFSLACDAYVYIYNAILYITRLPIIQLYVQDLNNKPSLVHLCTFYRPNAKFCKSAMHMMQHVHWLDIK
jgi:hypothetical protein